MTSQSFPNFHSSLLSLGASAFFPPCPLLCSLPLALGYLLLVLSPISCPLFWLLLTSTFWSHSVSWPPVWTSVWLLGFCWHSLAPSVIIQSLGHFWWLSMAQTHTPGPIWWLQVTWYTPYWPLENGRAVADFFDWCGLWIGRHSRVFTDCPV